MSLPNDFTLLHHNYLIDDFCEFYGVSWHNDCFTSQVATESFTHQELAHMNINGTQDIIQQINISA